MFVLADEVSERAAALGADAGAAVQDAEPRPVEAAVDAAHLLGRRRRCGSGRRGSRGRRARGLGRRAGGDAGLGGLGHGFRLVLRGGFVVLLGLVVDFGGLPLLVVDLGRRRGLRELRRIGAGGGAVARLELRHVGERRRREAHCGGHCDGPRRQDRKGPHGHPPWLIRLERSPARRLTGSRDESIRAAKTAQCAESHRIGSLS